jgi:hypothetical protein
MVENGKWINDWVRVNCPQYKVTKICGPPGNPEK